MKGGECFGKTSFVGFKFTVEQIGVKKNHNTAFCDEELKFGTAIEEAMRKKTYYRAKYYRSWLCDPGRGFMLFSYSLATK